MIWRIPALTVLVNLVLVAANAQADPLPSWNDTEARARIISFVESVADPDSSDYITPADRIAVFDNDGTLWTEQPVYFQLIYAMDELKRMADADATLLTSDALKSAAAGDAAALAQGGEQALLEVINATHGNLSVEAYQANVAAWLDRARHPSTGLAYDEMIYQPMLELLSYLRDREFKTYIVSGGGLHFMRVFAERAYGIPNEQVIGTYSETAYEVVDGVPSIVKRPGIAFVDDKAGKPINIDRVIGKRPVIAAGNSDGDYAMIEWTTAGSGPRLGIIVHHTDEAREYAYDCDGHIGRLCDGLENGPALGWLLVDMAEDWARVFSSRSASP